MVQRMLGAAERPPAEPCSWGQMKRCEWGWGSGRDGGQTPDSQWCWVRVMGGRLSHPRATAPSLTSEIWERGLYHQQVGGDVTGGRVMLPPDTRPLQGELAAPNRSLGPTLQQGPGSGASSLAVGKGLFERGLVGMCGVPGPQGGRVLPSQQWSLAEALSVELYPHAWQAFPLDQQKHTCLHPFFFLNS